MSFRQWLEVVSILWGCVTLLAVSLWVYLKIKILLQKTKRTQIKRPCVPKNIHFVASITMSSLNPDLSTEFTLFHACTERETSFEISPQFCCRRAWVRPSSFMGSSRILEKIFPHNVNEFWGEPGLALSFETLTNALKNALTCWSFQGRAPRKTLVGDISTAAAPRPARGQI